MANQEQLERLKAEVEGWNKWRVDNLEEKIDLSNADLSGDNLSGAHLSLADLSRANLSNAKLIRADLTGAFLGGADLKRADLRGGAYLLTADFSEADLRDADLQGADLRDAKLLGADLQGADLSNAKLIRADLGNANLRVAYLSSAYLRGANLRGADLERAILNDTDFADLDLRETKGLDQVIHGGPSPISTTTLKRSEGKIPEEFLRGCGLSDWEIEEAKLYNPDLSNEEMDTILYRIHDLKASQALQINPLFISYSHTDGKFVDAIEQLLNKKGIRFWRDIHDMTSGKLAKVVDRAIRQNPTMLLVLSEKSVKSDWVEHEARKARELEKETGRDVLCPVALDEAWKSCDWDPVLKDQIMKYHIMDFSEWRDEEEFGKKFGKLVEGLDLFYKK